KYDASIHNPEIAGLDWKDLTDEEKSTVPPVLLVIDREFIKEVGWKEIHHLLSQDYPIKLILMDDLAPDRYSALTEYSTLFAGFLSALLLKNAYIFSGGLHDVDHLYDGLMEGLHGNSPALFHIHVTNFEQHTRPSSDLASYSRLASDSRTLPLLKYNPLRKSDFLRGAIQLENNKVIDEDSVNMEMELTDGTKVNYPLTWADWAYTQKQWHEAFVELDRGENWRFIPEFLALTPVERKEVHPVILRWDESGVKYYRPSLDILKICEIIIDQWRTLQELSGLLFEFPQKLQRDMENKIRQQFDGEAEKLEEAYTVKLAAQRHDAMNVVKNQLKERLIMLSKMTKNQLEN
ncbi:MAG: hypothetical protein KDC53_04635, partial [Saprospiraceae bacterium]|nr:hypothetical protein [Saprospiraceae bacterium]